MIEQVKELSSLHESGILTDDEFVAANHRLVAETDAHMAAFNRDARQLYDNFMKTLS